MTKVTLAGVGSLIDVTTAQTTINNNFDAIVTAFENTLSRDGTSPNTMGAALDMNSNSILNQGNTSYTVATLPTPAVLGRTAVVSDGTASLAWGATVTGGASTKYLVWYNGSNWTVLGK